jgi:hypothetical protein
MDPLMERIVESKRQYRAKLSALSFQEKIAIVEKMRERDKAIAAAGLRGKKPSTPSPR